MTGPSGSLCLGSMRLSSTALQTHLLFRLALSRFFHLLHPCNCHWRCLLLRLQTRHRHHTRPTWLTTGSATMLRTRMVPLRHPRHCHLCLSATPATLSRRKGAAMITLPSLLPSASPMVCKITHRHVIPHKLAQIPDSRCQAFPFLPARHKTTMCPCPSRKLTTCLLLTYLPEQWVWYSLPPPEVHTFMLA